MRLKLDQDSLGLSSLLERRTGTTVKDCFQDDTTVYVVVAPGELGRVLGKGGENIRKVQEEIRKKIKVIEFRDNPVDFVRKVIYPLMVPEVREQEDTILILSDKGKTKSLLMGRNGHNLKMINRAVQRFFKKEVKVL